MSLMDANGNIYQQSRVIGWKRNTNHSRNSRRKRKTLKGSTPSRLCSINTEPVVTTKQQSSTTIVTDKRPRGAEEDRVHMSLEELRTLLPNTDITGGTTTTKDSPKSQEELLAMAVEYLRTRQHSRGIPSSDHNATATPHSKRSRRKHQHQLNNGQVTESAATPHHNAAFHPSSSTTTDAMLEGFRECMEETIRYLIEVERLAPDHDIVVRLRAHLLKAQSKLDMNNRITVEGGRLDVVSSSSCNARVKTEYGQAAVVAGATISSTQTSPDVAATYAKSPQIPVWVPSGTGAGRTTQSLAPTTLAAPSRVVTSVSRSRGLPDSTTKVMKPLTVDTNQYYAMPSPLSHCSSDSNQSNSNEPLLTIARTVPTTSQPMYSTACVTGRTLSYRRQQAVATHGTYLQRPVHSTCPTMVYSKAALTAPITATALPSSVTSATGHHLGFNLNYVAPYIMAWVRPAQQ